MEKVFKLLMVYLLIQGGVVIANNGFLSSDDIKKYYQEGYFIKQDAIESSKLEEISKIFDTTMSSVLQNLSQDDYPISDDAQKAYFNGSQVVFKKQQNQEIAILRVVGCGSMEPRFLSLLRSKKMLNTFFDLLDTKKIEHLICQMHPKKPNDGVSFPIHCDRQHRKNFDPEWEDVNGNGSYSICVVAIDPMSSENGGLYIDKNSFPIKSEGEKEIVSIELNAGDMLFIHPELLHGSFENTSNKSRRVLLTGYCVLGANHRNYPGNCTNDIFLMI